jgi:hypothetical protein
LEYVGNASFGRIGLRLVSTGARGHRALVSRKMAERVGVAKCRLITVRSRTACHEAKGNSRCRHTGQYHPLAFFFLLSRPVAVVPPATGGAGAPAAAAAASAPPAGVSPVPVSPSSLLATLPPAPNSIIPTAQSRQTTRCLQGRSTTSRGEVRHTMHSFGVDAYGSASPGGYEVGCVF